jgi:hypothetical protein
MSAARIHVSVELTSCNDVQYDVVDAWFEYSDSAPEMTSSLPGDATVTPIHEQKYNFTP